jgi:hypothetical protein
MTNEEGGEGGGGAAPLAAAGEHMAPTRSWVKESWKVGDDTSRKRATVGELFVVCVVS